MNSFVFIGLIASLAASLSFFAEFSLQHPPCFLCLIQRALWLTLLFAAILGAFFKTFAKKLIVLLLALNLCVAAYHTLVQLKIIEDRCTTNLQIKNKAAYTEILKKAPTQGCSKEAWKIGMIPAPLLNGAVSLVLLCFIWRRRD